MQQYAEVSNGSVVRFFSAATKPAFYVRNKVLPVRVDKPPLGDNQIYYDQRYIVTDTEVVDVWSARDVTLEERVLKARNERAARYPALGDGLDAFVKFLAANPTLAIPTSTQEYIDTCLEVKTRVPIPTE